MGDKFGVLVMLIGILAALWAIVSGASILNRWSLSRHLPPVRRRRIVGFAAQVLVAGASALGVYLML